MLLCVAAACPNNDIHYFADSQHCQWYYVCTNGIKYHMRCPATLYYNPGTKMCDYPSNVTCPAAAPSTTAATTTEATTSTTRASMYTSLYGS